PTPQSASWVNSKRTRDEVVVDDRDRNEKLRRAIHELQIVRPYEEVAYDVYRFKDF
ncbi:uncharacterized protein PHACADRAFT_98742, partial [Phanerochaete carnosa HHB-10118-sp]